MKEILDTVVATFGGTGSGRSAGWSGSIASSADRQDPVPPCLKSAPGVSSNEFARSTAAFTILEILVASAILVVIVGMVVGLTGLVMRGWNQGTSSLARDAQLQQAYQLLQYDLEAAVVTPDDRPWLWFEETSSGGLSLRWLVPAPDGKGLELIEWALEPRDAMGAATVDEWALFRQNVGAVDWPAAFGEDGSIGSGRPMDAFSANSDWWQAFVLAHVLEWSWEMYIQDRNGSLIALSEDGLLPTGGPNAFPLLVGDRRWRAPERIELRLRVLSTEAVRQYDRLREELGEGEQLDAFLAQETRMVAWCFHPGGPS